MAYDYQRYITYIRGPIWAGISFRRKQFDLFTCQDCGACRADDPDLVLDVHHKAGYQFLYYEESCPDAWNSIITLCRACHKKRHIFSGPWTRLRPVTWADLERRFKNLSG